MSEIVERIARVLYESHAFLDKNTPWEKWCFKDMERIQARAVIEVIEEMGIQLPGPMSCFRKIVKKRLAGQIDDWHPGTSSKGRDGKRVVRVRFVKEIFPSQRMMNLIEKEMKDAGYLGKVSKSMGGASIKFVLDEAPQ